MAWKDNAIRRGMRTLEPAWFGFVKISNHGYVDKAMSPGEQAHFLNFVAAAKKQVAHFFRKRPSNPNILACSTEKCFVPNHNGAAPKGEDYGDSAVLVSPSGLNATILSHELTHAELNHRVGVLRLQRSIPHWFNEGLAVLVSQPPIHLQSLVPGNGRRKKAPNPEANGDMLGHGNWLLSYGTAREIVGNWYGNVGRTGLENLIRDVRNREDFLSSFNTIAEEHGEKPTICPNVRLHSSCLL